MNVSIGRQNPHHIEPEETAGSDHRQLGGDVVLRRNLVYNPIVRRVLDRTSQSSDHGPTAHSKHSSHSKHATHATGWLSPKR